MLNFANADIESTIRAVGLITNKNFIIDPRVKGTINIVSSNPVSKRDVYAILLSALRLQGFTAVEGMGVTKIVPEAEAKLHGPPIRQSRIKSGGDQIVTQVYPLQNESAAQLVPILRPLITPNNLIAAYPGSNTLVITDYADNIARLNKIIAAIDQPQDNLLMTIPLKNGSAVDMAQLIGKLMPDVTSVAGNFVQGQPIPQGAFDGTRKTVVLPDLRTNSLIVKAASGTQLAQVKKLVEQMDVPLNGAGNIRVIYLKNAEASRLVQTLRGVLTGQGGGDTTSGASNASNAGSSSPFGQNTANTGGSSFGSSGNSGFGTSGGSNLGSSGLQAGSGFSAAGAIIQADPATNSLIVNAPEPVYNNVRAIVEKLDVRRAQVYVETLIAEVNVNKAGEFGIQWLVGGERSDISVVGASTNGGTGTNIVNLAGAIASGNPATIASQIGAGLNIGVLNGSFSGKGTANLGALATALASSGAGNVLSTPNILTLDNEQATILVGNNVPFVTGTQSSTGSNPNPFTTVERKDIGISLKIKPQVSEGGTITLSVYQEVSGIDESTTQLTGGAGLATTKRAIESKVLVDDGQIIVLGGLMEDRVTTNRSSVPVLGDIPLLGNLFRYESRSHRKVNLMVFIRPVVLRDGVAAAALSSDRYDLLRRVQTQTGASANILLPEVPVITLPEAPKVPAPSKPAETPKDDTGNAKPSTQQP